MRQSLQPSRDPGDYQFVHRVRTRFGETDAMGVIHHAAYLLYLEEARLAYFSELGHPYGEVRRDGLDAPVLEIAVHYRRPLNFDEEVAVHLWGGAVTRTTFQLAYLLMVDGEARATAVTVHGCVDVNGKASRLPSWIAEVFVA